MRKKTKFSFVLISIILLVSVFTSMYLFKIPPFQQTALSRCDVEKKVTDYSCNSNQDCITAMNLPSQAIDYLSCDNNKCVIEVEKCIEKL